MSPLSASCSTSWSIPSAKSTKSLSPSPSKKHSSSSKKNKHSSSKRKKSKQSSSSSKPSQKPSPLVLTNVPSWAAAGAAKAAIIATIKVATPRTNLRRLIRTLPPYNQRGGAVVAELLLPLLLVTL